MITFIALVALLPTGTIAPSQQYDRPPRYYEAPDMKLVADGGNTHIYFVDIKKLVRAGLIRALDGRALAPAYKHEIARCAMDAVRNLEIELERLQRMPNAKKAEDYLKVVPAVENLLTFTSVDFRVLGMDGRIFVKDLATCKQHLGEVALGRGNVPYISKVTSLRRFPRHRSPKPASIDAIGDHFPDVPGNHEFYYPSHEFFDAGLTRGEYVLHGMYSGPPDRLAEFAGRTLNRTRNLEIAAEKLTNAPDAKGSAYLTHLATKAEEFATRFSTPLTYFKVNSRMLEDDLAEVKRMLRPK